MSELLGGFPFFTRGFPVREVLQQLSGFSLQPCLNPRGEGLS